MNRKVIFLDCDGTIFDVPRNMLKASDKTRYAIKELIKNGHLVFIASGRCKCLLPDDVVDLNPSGFITTNGTYAYMKDKVIFEKPLKQESINLLIDYCKENNGLCFLESQDYIYIRSLDDPLYVEFVDAWDVKHEIFKDKLLTDKWYLMMSVFRSEDECIRFENKLQDKLDIRRQYGFTSFDVTDFGNDKGLGVKKVLEYLNIDKKDAYAFGDGLNDLEMLEAVGESYAMENGNPKLKALAKNIAPDVLDDGFYQIMCQDGLIEPIKDKEEK